MNVEISKQDVELAEQFWNEEGFPLLRPANEGEIILLLGWSLGQDKEVLLSREVGEDENYGEAAAEAAYILEDYLPVNFTSDGEILVELSTGFYDLYSDWYPEITFDQPWHVSILQAWLDNLGAKICIKPSNEIAENKLILDHVERATYSIDTSARYGYFKHMSVRNAINQFVSEYWHKQNRLPDGKHDIKGTEVTFHN